MSLGGSSSPSQQQSSSSESGVGFNTDFFNMFSPLPSGGGGYQFGGLGGGGGQPQQPQGPPMADWVVAALKDNTATGLSWDTESRSWKNVTGNPDLVWDSFTNTTYYRGTPVSSQELNMLFAQGPEVFGANPLSGPANQFLNTLSQQPYQGPTMPAYVTRALQEGTATGQSWDAATRSWKNVTGRPDLVWDSFTNTVFYRGRALSTQELTDLFANGPASLDMPLQNTGLGYIDPRSQDIPYITPTGPLPTAQAQAMQWAAAAVPHVQAFLSALPSWMPRDVRVPNIPYVDRAAPTPYVDGVPHIGPLGQEFWPRDVTAPQVRTEQAGMVDFESPAARTQMEARFGALTGRPLKEMNTRFDQQLEQTRAQLAATGMLASPAGQGVILRQLEQQNEELDSMLFTASKEATAEFAAQEQRRLEYNTEKRDQANTREEQYFYNSQVVNAGLRLSMAQLQTQRALADQNADSTTLQMRQQINMVRSQQDEQNLQRLQQVNLAGTQYIMAAQLANQQVDLSRFNLATQDANANAARVNEARMFNAGFDFTRQQLMWQGILGLNAQNATELNAMTKFGADLRFRELGTNLGAYTNLSQLSTNAILGIKNLALGSLQMLQGERAMDINQQQADTSRLGMLNQYQLQAGALFAQQIATLLQFILGGSQYTEQQMKGKSGGGFGVNVGLLPPAPSQ